MTTDDSFYSYHPQLAIAVVAAVLFGVSFVVSIWQYFQYRAWVWMVMLLAVGAEATGFIARCVSIKQPTNNNVYVVQFTLVVLAPVLMAGNIYVIFGRLLFLVTPPGSRNLRTLWCPPRFVTLIFVVFDIFSIFLQLIGAVMMSSTSSSRDQFNRGRSIALIGVIIQLVAFGFFTLTAMRFFSVARRFAGYYAARVGGEKHEAVLAGRRIRVDWQCLLVAICVACVLILVRSVFRLIEFAANDSAVGTAIQNHEWFMYVFDALPMLVVVISFNFAHPGMYLPFLGFRLPKSERTAGESAEDTERTLGEGYQV